MPEPREVLTRLIASAKIIENQSGLDQDEARRLAIPFSIVNIPFNQSILYSALVGINQADNRPTTPSAGGAAGPSYAFLNDYVGHEADPALKEMESLGFKASLQEIPSGPDFHRRVIRQVPPGPELYAVGTEVVIDVGVPPTSGGTATSTTPRRGSGSTNPS